MQGSDGPLFIKLSRPETIRKISNLKSISNVLIWQKTAAALSCDILQTSFEDNNAIIYLRCNQEDLIKVKDIYFMKLTIGPVAYFSKGTIQTTPHPVVGEFQLKLTESVFKHEKRDKERLLLFPHHEAYANFSVESGKSSSNNLLYLNKSEKSNVEMIKKFVEQKSEQGDNICRFRVMDLSVKGISFIVNQTEFDYFFNKDSGGYDFSITLNKDEFPIKNASVKYRLDYIDSRFPAISMKKIGMHFERIGDLLNTTIKELLGQEFNNDGALKEFEEFV
ncbi:MAG: hypothetical protein ISR65_02620 [Bacteriovoracaceae bacterium]|nr:hypothetical protein [Bacteriovoracaceae bacterium]